MLSGTTTTTILLALFIQHVEGVIIVNESDVHDDHAVCCIYGNCSCPSLYSALTNLTNNVLINITTDVELSSIIPLVDLATITITGHNNPTVDCNNSGGIQFMLCYNCTVEGITWERCGSRNIGDGGNVYPAIQLLNSSNITIKNCSFQHSIGQAVVLLGVSGDVNIDNCSFLYNTEYKDLGAAIYYSSSIFPLNFTITNCKFSYNEGAKSIVCFEKSSTTSLHLQNSEFHCNKGVPIYLSNQNLHITGNVKFHGNTAENGAGIVISDHSNVTFHKLATINFTNNTAMYNGGSIFLTNHSSIQFKSLPNDNQSFDNESCALQSIIATFHNNTAQYGGAIYVDNSNVSFGDCSSVIMISNNAEQYGGVLYSKYSIIEFEGNSAVTYKHNSARFGAAVYVYLFSDIKFEGSSKMIFTDNINYYYGGAVFIDDHCTGIFKGNSALTFANNTCKGDAGALYIDRSTTVTVEENATLIFNNNQANLYSGAVIINHHSTVMFKGISTVIFVKNTCNNTGGALHIDWDSHITLEDTTTLIFSNNHANYSGGAITMKQHSSMTFKGNSSIAFNNNGPSNYGGAMVIGHDSTVIFDGNSTAAFSNNIADRHSGALYVYQSSAVTFEGNSTVSFNNNKAYTDGGAIYVNDLSSVTFNGYSIATFANNEVGTSGGAVFVQNGTVIFEENSVAVFLNNIAGQGGALYIDWHSRVRFKENTASNFSNNSAYTIGGAAAIYRHSNIKFEGNSVVTFLSNICGDEGGAILIDLYSAVTVGDYTKLIFSNNNGKNDGGAIVIHYSIVTFEGNCTAIFDTNVAQYGGAVAVQDSSSVIFGEYSTAKFNDNEAGFDGGAMCIDDHSIVTFKGNSKTMLENNAAEINGGGMCIYYSSVVTFEGNSTVTLYNNEVESKGTGGAVYLERASVVARGKSNIKCDNNNAGLGGALFITASKIELSNATLIEFTNNTALQDGGAIYLSDQSNLMLLAEVIFYHNTANYYGKDIYMQMKNSSVYYGSNVHFKCSHKGIINVFIDVVKSCDSRCLLQNFRGIDSNVTLQVATSPGKLKLYDPAKFITGDSMDYDTYYMRNIMLGQEIIFDGCVLDFYNQPTEAKEFVITAIHHQDYNISGPKYISIACNHTTKPVELSVIGNLHSNNSYNYSIMISLYTTQNSDSKIVAAKLIVELSQCHPGFWYSSKSQKCECYSTNIISCSGSSSTIKRGYWFGSINGKPTVASCPSDYCNFTCCEISNGIYHLSPVRENQCRPHRNGAACGNCENGYTLSFDSPKCIEINECTVGQTILVTVLSLLYWIAVVVAAFVMTHFKVAIGSLYGIIYYYSIVDILLNQILHISNGLHTTVSIMSSFAKLTPQFLGQLCFVRNMSGIDQQFIHYVHPLAVLLILIMISVVARRSPRVSIFVSRGVIQFICFLLLLSYTSVATTSLLLMQPLTFVDIDKRYTYLSPDIEYFHERHFPYAIVAIILIILIVVGFPLLLLGEPFLNSKISIDKIIKKPLLDQFQGCYKGKYCRSFAGYYMICRLVIISLVIMNNSDDFTTQYLLISSCALMQLIHVLVRPYASTIHNILDGIILQLIVIISVLRVVEFFDDYDETLVVVVAYLLVICPIVLFITIKLWTTCHQYKHNTIRNGDASEVAETTNISDNYTMMEDDDKRKNAIMANLSCLPCLNINNNV